MLRQKDAEKQLSNDAIGTVIEDSLKQFFGETTAELIYRYVESNRHINRDDVPQNLESFFSGLKDICGSGANVLESFILKKLRGEQNAGT
jgi:hypothetical protein